MKQGLNRRQRREHEQIVLKTIEAMEFGDVQEWTLDGSKELRGITYSYDENDTTEICCPLTAWHLSEQGHFLYADQWEEAAKQLAIEDEVAFDIVDAADDGYMHNPKFRAALLRKCGLEEATA